MGFELPSSSELPLESNLTLRGEDIAGRITSVARSPVLEKIIGLAYVHPDQTEIGTQLPIKLSNGERINAKVVDTPFYDPETKRQAL